MKAGLTKSAADGRLDLDFLGWLREKLPDDAPIPHLPDPHYLQLALAGWRASFSSNSGKATIQSA
jgi:hypothetical protein